MNICNKCFSKINSIFLTRYVLKIWTRSNVTLRWELGHHDSLSLKGFELFPNNGSIRIFPYYMKHCCGLRTGFVAQSQWTEGSRTTLLEAFPASAAISLRISNSSFGGSIGDICTSC